VRVIRSTPRKSLPDLELDDVGLCRFFSRSIVSHFSESRCDVAAGSAAGNARCLSGVRAQQARSDHQEGRSKSDGSVSWRKVVQYGEVDHGAGTVRSVTMQRGRRAGGFVWSDWGAIAKVWG
jgi:hypothetical protein